MPAPRQPAGAAVLQEDKTTAIVDAAFAELAEQGWRGTRVDAIAARAGVGKAALYRRWPSKDAMLLDLIVQAGDDEFHPPDTGCLRDDLIAYGEHTAEVLAHPLVVRIVPDVMAHMQRDPELSEAINRLFRMPRRNALRHVVERAIAREELPKTADVELMLDMLAGALLLQALAPGHGTRAGDVCGLVDATLRAFA